MRQTRSSGSGVRFPRSCDKRTNRLHKFAIQIKDKYKNSEGGGADPYQTNQGLAAKVSIANERVGLTTGAEGEGEKIVMLSAMQYPHWLMVAGAVLVVLGFIGFAFRQNRNGPDDEPSPMQENANGK